MNENIFLYKLMKYFKNNGISIFNVEYLYNIYPLLILILEGNGITDFVKKYNTFEKFYLRFCLVFLDFELGIFKNDTFIFNDEQDLLDSVFKKDLIDISNNEINEIVKTLKLKYNKNEELIVTYFFIVFISFFSVFFVNFK